MTKFFKLAVCSVALLGCGGSPMQSSTLIDSSGGPPAPDAAMAVSYAQDVQPLWDTYCTSCHDGTSKDAKEALSLLAPSSWTNLQRTTSGCDMPTEEGGGATQVVVAGNPDQSPLWLRISGGNTCYAEMPPKSNGGLQVMDAAAADTVRRWILAGAQNN